LIRPYTRQVILVGVVMLAQTLARLASPWTLKLVLDCVLGDQAPPSWLAWLVGDPAGPERTLWVAVGGTLAIALVEASCQYASALLTATVGQRVSHDLRRMIYAHLQRLSLAYFDKQELGPIVSTVTEDIKVIQDFASQQLVVIVVDVLTIAGIASVMLSIDWAFTLIALGAMPLVIWVAYWIRKTLKVVQRDVRAKQSEIVSIVQEGLGAIRVVKAFARGRYERARLDAKSLESVDAALRARKSTPRCGRASCARCCPRS
jgi:subfamily B ATP-binding cassette protein MsbA